MKLAVLVNENFRAALTKLTTQKIPLKAAFKLKGIVQTVNQEFAKYEEVRESALTRFGKKDENGVLILNASNAVTFESEGLAQFQKEMSELISSDIEVTKIKIDELGNEVDLSVADLMSLDEIIEA